MTHRVLVTDKVALSGLYPLSNHRDVTVIAVDDSDGREFISELARAHALIVRSATDVSADLIGRAGELRAIGRAGVGLDNVDVAFATSRGVAVFNAPGANTVAAAELTIGLMLAVARRITAGEASVRANRWERNAFTGVELKGKTLGLIGAGRIGGEVATRSLAFGMEVIVYDPYLDDSRAAELGARLVGLDEVLDHSDFISIHVPLTEETRGMLGGDALRRMKSSAHVINASRGGVIDESALSLALGEGWIAGAALDVFATEPLPPESPLREAPNLVLTPHLGASTFEAQEGVATEVAEKIVSLLETGDKSEAVNARELV